MAVMCNKYKNPNTVRIAQLNAQNSKLVVDELRQVIVEEKIDVIALQEPYNSKGLIRGLGITTKTISDVKKFSNIPKDNDIKSAIAIFNPEINVLKLEHLCNTHFACAELSTFSSKFFIVSAYLQYSDPIEQYIFHLEKILLELRGQEIIMCLDANARSTMWHNNESNAKGEILESFVLQHRLVIVNSPQPISTFDNTRGSSNIDVTLGTNAIGRKLRNWKVHKYLTTSDHNLISFEIVKGTQYNTPQLNNRFNTKRANWDAYRKELQKQIQQTGLQNIGNDTEAQFLSEHIDKVILEAGEITIPKKNIFIKSVPWWNTKLTELRKKMMKARHKMQRTGDQTARKRLLGHFRCARNNYITEIRKAKQVSWEKFVTCEGNRDPWSIVYKMQTNKLKVETVQSNLRTNNKFSTTWKETAQILLNALIPDDDKNSETIWHTQTRRETLTIGNIEDSPPFTIEETGKIIKKLNERKAPGRDLIEVGMIKEAWPVMQNEFMMLFNNCLAQKVFPEQYKYAQIRVLLKGEDKDKTDPKSYRPISLLPIIGKILEKLIAGRLQALVNDHSLSSCRQFGFRPGKSTEDALVLLNNIVNGINSKYVVGLLFDITGAFDNVWWPSVLQSLKKRDCPSNLYGLMQSYLSERKAEIVTAVHKEVKTVTKGCPQGSVLGPLLWNLLFDEIVESLWSEGNEPIAFADDLMVVIHADSRKDIERKANSVTGTLEEWCRNHKLVLSKNKSEMLLMKGFLDIRRPPTIKIETSTLKMRPVVRYLGIHLGTRMNITPHINYITEKSRNVFAGLVKLAKEKWGLTTKIIRSLYTGLVLQILCYAAAGWAERLNTHHVRKLKSAQRQALLAITRAYRTTSNEALTVLAAEIPIELKIQERKVLYCIRRNTEVGVGSFHFSPLPTPIESSQFKQIKNEVRAEIISLWQQKWDESEKGRITHKYFGNIKRRMEMKHIKINHNTAQFITGHGYFNSKLHKFGLSDTELCKCGLTDTPEHVIFDCKEEEANRRVLVQELEKQGKRWPVQVAELVEGHTLQHLTKFANNAIKGRQQWNM